jgi:hypothetical protein
MPHTGIPTALEKTFRNAVFAYINAQRGVGGDWDPRPATGDMTYWNKTIGDIAIMASIYDDPLPEDIFETLRALAPQGRRDFPQTFAAAGLLLSAMYEDHLKELRSKGIEPRRV